MLPWNQQIEYPGTMIEVPYDLTDQVAVNIVRIYWNL